jgi:hypothetical protein
MSFHRGRGLLCAAALVLAVAVAWSEKANTSIPANLSVAELLDQMQRHNLSQTEGLRHYQAVRHYHVEYRGFATTIAANMEVAVNFDASSGKSFRIVSQSGSKLLCEKVLKKAVDSEKEASQDKGATALTPGNYRFQLAGSESLDGRPAYILDVEPLKPSKFLYRGKIWVDSTDFAVVKIEAEPARNPSFWISRPLIRSVSAKTGDFWLPKQNRSETKVRIGGTAVLTIDYGSYQISSEPPHPAAEH